MRSLRRAGTRDVVLVAMAVVLLAAAVFMYVRLSGGDAAPDDEFIGLYCPDCAHYFEISHREFERRFDNREFKLLGEEKALFFECEQCEQMTAERVDEPPAEGQTESGGG